MLYSRNSDLVQAFGNLGAPHTVSNHTQWLLSQVFADDAFLTAFAKTNQALLTEAYATVISSLRAQHIAYVPARGSLFVWAQLNDNPKKSDEDFWRELYESTGILLTSPNGFGHSSSGWLRIVYSCVSTSTLQEALRRLFTSRR